MRRLLAVLLLAAALLSAWAEQTELIVCDCGQAPCVCFLQEGDEGVAVGGVTDLLKTYGYMDPKHARYAFDEEVTQAVRAFQADCGLLPTGTLDDATLSLLIGNEDEMSEEKLFVVWVPVRGGRKFHADPACSGMKTPRKMSIVNALSLNIEPCKRCCGSAAQ